MNGWKNYETWNVSLWIQNDETLYKLALMSAGFQSFMNQVHEWGCDQTQDGVKWVDADYSEVQSMFNEMKATTDLDYWKSALVHFQNCPPNPPQWGFFAIIKESNELTQMIDPRFEDEALSALMEEAFSQTEEETKFDVDAYFNSDIDY